MTKAPDGLNADKVVSLDDVVMHSYRVASKSNVFEIQMLLGVLMTALPPTATMSQGMAFCVICKHAVSGRRISASQLRRLAEEDIGVDFLGSSVARTVRALAETGLVKVTDSEDDRRSKEISLTKEGFVVLDRAMDMIS